MVRLETVSKLFGTGDRVQALAGVSVSVPRGQRVALVGPSGSGKSTLLNLIGGLDRPSSGRVIVAGLDLATLDDDQLSRVRGELIGFVFQSFNLLASLTALENVALPLRLRGVSAALARQRSQAALAAVSLTDRADHRPDQLSGGQKQRVAIARALVGEPKLLLADEPTGNLDSRTGKEILSLIEGIAERLQLTVLMVTHDLTIAEQLERQVQLQDGRIVADTRPRN
jgi:putative ABC transport system ATP-binding protein